MDYDGELTPVIRSDWVIPGWHDVWTPEQKAEAERLLEGLHMRIERRGEASYVPGTLCLAGNIAAIFPVVVAKTRNEDLTVISPKDLSHAKRARLRTPQGVQQGHIVASRNAGRKGDDGVIRWFLQFRSSESP